MAMAKETVAWWRGLLGIELSPVSHRERLISALGACIGMMLVYAMTRAVFGPGHALVVAAPVGATAVLLFAIPHSAMSQPWPVVGGYAISTTVGVACAMLVPNELVAAGLAVGLSVAFMHYLHCLHPPGGAIALMAVIGGDPIRQMGFNFVVAPVLINVLIVVAAAIVFGAFFPWRRYPAILGRAHTRVVPDENAYQAITHEDFVYALTQIDSFIDVSEEDILRIYALATQRKPRTGTSGEQQSATRGG